jgi:hypothetical protein
MSGVIGNTFIATAHPAAINTKLIIIDDHPCRVGRRISFVISPAKKRPNIMKTDWKMLKKKNPFFLPKSPQSVAESSDLGGEIQ